MPKLDAEYPDLVILKFDLMMSGVHFHRILRKGEQGRRKHGNALKSINVCAIIDSSRINTAQQPELGALLDLLRKLPAKLHCLLPGDFKAFDRDSVFCSDVEPLWARSQAWYGSHLHIVFRNILAT